MRFFLITYQISATTFLLAKMRPLVLKLESVCCDPWADGVRSLCWSSFQTLKAFWCVLFISLPADSPEAHHIELGSDFLCERKLFIPSHLVWGHLLPLISMWSSHLKCMDVFSRKLIAMCLWRQGLPSYRHLQN